MGKKKDKDELKEMQEALDARQKDLDAMADTLAEKMTALEEKEAEIQEKAKDLIAQERRVEALKDGASVDAPVEEPELSELEKKLVAQGCEAYGIGEEFLLKARIETDGELGTKTAVLITHGGAKVRYQRDQEVTPLDPVRVDGISRKPKRKPIAGRVNSPKA